jgi:hypothetical protein
VRNTSCAFALLLFLNIKFVTVFKKSISSCECLKCGVLHLLHNTPHFYITHHTFLTRNTFLTHHTFLTFRVRYLNSVFVLRVRNFLSGGTLGPLFFLARIIYNNIQQLYALLTLYLCVLYLSENKQRLVLFTA